MKINSSTLIQAAITGMGFGFIVTVACVIANIGLTGIAVELLVWLVASALFGIISALVFYTPNNLSLPAAMVIHCAGCIIVGVAAAAICGYVNGIDDIVFWFLPVFLAIYAVIYLVCFLIMKHNEKQINEALKKE